MWSFDKKKHPIAREHDSINILNITLFVMCNRKFPPH